MGNRPSTCLKNTTRVLTGAPFLGLNQGADLPEGNTNMLDLTPMEFADWLHENKIESAASLETCDSLFTRDMVMRVVFPTEIEKRVRYILTKRTVLTSIPPNAVWEE